MSENGDAICEGCVADASALFSAFVPPVRGKDPSAKAAPDLIRKATAVKPFCAECYKGYSGEFHNCHAHKQNNQGSGL